MNEEINKEDELNEEDILAIKEARIRKDNEEEVEEEKKEHPDTPFWRFMKKLDFFWEYYKWFIIIPTLIIVAGGLTVASCVKDSRPRYLELAIMNEESRVEMISAIENDFIADTSRAYTAKDLRIEYAMQYPDMETFEGAIGDVTFASMQKFNTMVLTGNVDIAITNTWVADAYTEQRTTTDLREMFDEEYLKEHEDDIYYSKDEAGEVIPVGFYIRSKIFTDSYDEKYPPVVISFNSAPHPEEKAIFMKWLAEYKKDDV
ncbi:MAG: hypothetical protein J6X45_07580 [Lachnospiraceae bacterium]|nr:hypothetical protein [Lachnospiraceae bacterium]MBP5565565.1 hypothetical protein [Lachnospiraceae bacterium]